MFSAVVMNFASILVLATCTARGWMGWVDFVDGAAC